MSWDKYFIEMLPVIASKSKDPSTKVAAIITDPNHIILATGFNGFPRGVVDTEKRYENRTLKYKYIVHAEANAVFAAAKKGIALDSGTIYISWIPCCECTKAIIQSGIQQIVFDGKDFQKQREYWNQRWLESILDSLRMLQESSVHVDYLDHEGDLVPVTVKNYQEGI